MSCPVTLWISALVGLVVVFSGRATAVDAESPPASGLSFERLEYPFGVVRQGEVVEAEFPFANTGRVPLTVSSPIVGCECKAEIVGSLDIGLGESGRVRFSCDTAQLSGMVRRTATIHSSEVGRRAVVLVLSGEVRLDVRAEPSRVYLGRVLRGERRTNAFSVIVGSLGEQRTALLGSGTSGPHIGVVPTGAGSFEVTVRDDAPLGVFTQDVSVETTSEGFPVLTVPVTGMVVEELPARRW